DRGGAGGSGADAARVRRDRRRAGGGRAGRDLPGGLADEGRGDRAVQVRGRADPGTATGAGGAAGTTRLVGKHVEPARLAPGTDAGSAALPGARRTGRRRSAAAGGGGEGDRAAGARTARG